MSTCSARPPVLRLRRMRSDADAELGEKPEKDAERLTARLVERESASSPEAAISSC
jgi:hypothetical protein